MAAKVTDLTGGTKAATALTTAYSGWTHSVDVGALSRATLLLAYVYDSATSVELLIERSSDGTTYYSDQRESSTVGTLEDDALTRAVSASDNWSVPIDVSDTRYLRVTAKRTGGSSSDTLACTVIGGLAS